MTLSIDTQHNSFCAIMMSDVMLSVAIFYFYAKCRYAECRYAECP